MIDATTPTVPDSDTTYRVAGSRAVDLKCRALAAYFPPDEIRFLPKSPRNGKALALSYLTARAVMDRLDTVLGPDNWKDAYEDLDGGSVRCTLTVRFEPGGEWVSKSDVGSTSEQPDEGDRCKAAHSDSLKRAAVKFGVGRYLYSLPQVWADYDQQKRAFPAPPRLPEGVLPTAYRQCGRERARKIIGILESALASAKVERGEWRKAALNLIGDYGYKDAKLLPAIENRHADAIIQRLNQWVAEIARGVPNCPQSPLYRSPETLAAEQREAEKAALEKAEKIKAEAAKQQQAPTTTAKSAQTAQATAKTCKAPPATGAEFLARIQIKDDELSQAGRIRKNELKAHIIEEGAKRTYTTDLTRWNQAQIKEALAWAGEFIKGLPEPGTVPREPTEPQYAGAGRGEGY